MATTRQVIEGLEILERYKDPASAGEVCAEHDVIYAGHDVSVSEEDRARLDALGWHWDSGVDSWARFT